MTEMGVCFVFNNKFTDILSLKTNDHNLTNSNTDESLLECHYLDGLCYARYDSDPLEPVKFYIHSYLDVLHTTMDLPWYLKESEELEINYQMQETTSAPTLRQLTPQQRKCRFDDEPLTEGDPFYSTSMCYISCRYHLALKLCGCRPFFYHYMAGKLCDINGLLCVAKQAQYITGPSVKLACNCPQPCDIITYIPTAPKITLWKNGYFDQRITFRWATLHPTTKFRRDVLFGLQDLVVSFGGTLSLFLGISFISVIEIIFLISENLVGYFMQFKNDCFIKNTKRH